MIASCIAARVVHLTNRLRGFPQPLQRAKRVSDLVVRPIHTFFTPSIGLSEGKVVQHERGEAEKSKKSANVGKRRHEDRRGDGGIETVLL